MKYVGGHWVSWCVRQTAIGDLKAAWNNYNFVSRNRYSNNVRPQCCRNLTCTLGQYLGTSDENKEAHRCYTRIRTLIEHIYCVQLEDWQIVKRMLLNCGFATLVFPLHPLSVDSDHFNICCAAEHATKYFNFPLWLKQLSKTISQKGLISIKCLTRFLNLQQTLETFQCSLKQMRINYATDHMTTEK